MSLDVFSRRPGRSLSTIAVSLFFITLLLEAIYCFHRPQAGFDSLAYVSIANGLDHNTFLEASARCSDELVGPHRGCDEIPRELIDEVGSYSMTDFQTLMRFYTVKPLYTSLINGMHRSMQLSGFTALRIVSAVSFVVIGAVIWLWLREYLTLVGCSLFALLMVSFQNVLNLGKWLLPDAFSTALLLLTAYLVLYRRNKWAGAIGLFLLPIARPDNIIFVALFAGTLLWHSSFPMRKRLALVGALAVACLVMNVTLQKMTHGLSWPVLFMHSFITWTSPSSFPGTHITVHEYLHALASIGSLTLLLYAPPVLFFSAIALAGSRGRRPLRDLVLAGLATIAIRFLLFPGMEERYYTWLLLICMLAALSVIAPRLGTAAPLLFRDEAGAANPSISDPSLSY